MKISQKLILLFLVNAVVPLVLAQAISYFNTQQSLDRQIGIEINNAANRQTDKINNLVANDKQAVNVFPVQGSTSIFAAMHAYYSKPSKATQQTVNQTINDAYRFYDTAYRRIHVLNPDGVVIGSTDPAFIGRSYKDSDIFKNTQQDPKNPLVPTLYVADFFKDVDGNLAHYLVRSVPDGGVMMGYFVLEAPVDTYEFVTGDYSDLGQTGDTAILRQEANGSYEYLTPGRFNTSLPLTAYTTPKNRPNVDYRGHSVLRVTRDVDGVPWKVAVKMDTNEIYAPAISLRNLTIAIGVLTTLVVTFLGWYFSNLIVAPIKRFTEVVAKIQKGDLKLRVTVESQDEIGQLGKAFNQLTSNLLESRARLIASVLGLSQGFIMTDRDGVVTTINDAARRMLKLPDDGENQSLTLPAAFTGIENFNISELVQRCAGEKQTVEIRDVASHGSFFNVFLSPVAINDEVYGVAVLVSDETEEKILQRSRDEFFSIASHELRTPLTAIVGNASLMRTMYEDTISKEADLSQMVSDIEYSGQRLIAIVNDFLDVSSLELGKISYKNQLVDGVALAQSVVKDFEATGALNGSKLQVNLPGEPLPQGYGDVDRLKQVFINLVSNSAKFTDKGTIGISFVPSKDSKFIETSVTDTGQGISEEGQKLLFHKFQQGGNSTLTRDTAKGTGLGLYISKLIVEGMGGKLWMARTEVGKGSTFSFSLPVATPEQIRESELKANEAPATASSSAMPLAAEAPIVKTKA